MSADSGLVIEPDGTLRCIYDEVLDWQEFGAPVIHRGSHVEPDDQGNWFADLAPVQGPKLGPFIRRSDALTAERQWLTSHWLTAAR